ncbi:hypothetical protein FOF71_07985 [Lactobacillus paragasseri]|jgi:hypothetical protein|uniref:Uncharacterized protein n=1 Tax=Lactobacillus paragasseri TaxID=2107999 RepID=A0AAW6XL95_9LACO|nr:hypothetical protein [Lactobacillus paragasseri]MDK6868975.1 hypothetical protein [Lactobacillus paragasseri]TVU99416.1 hypothetical protein FOF71_07985 [Lactobacillus paragasseri]GBA91313.1 hypothetical protein LJCM5344_10450 [Lactobacillus paragasseri]
MSDEFRKWQCNTEQAIKEWPDKLVHEALKQNDGYIGKAKRWLKSKRPDNLDSFHGKPEEQFIVTIRAVYDEALAKLRKIADKQKVDGY